MAPWSDEKRAAQAERMRLLWAERREEMLAHVTAAGSKGGKYERTAEVRANNSASAKEMWTRSDYREKMSGENAPRWQGGKSFEEYGLYWTEEYKEDIRKRDDYTCQKCLMKQDSLVGFVKKLDVHHTNGDKQDDRTETKTTLCRSCHIVTHSALSAN